MFHLNLLSQNAVARRADLNETKARTLGGGLRRYHGRAAGAFGRSAASRADER